MSKLSKKNGENIVVAVRVCPVGHGDSVVKIVNDCKLRLEFTDHRRGIDCGFDKVFCSQTSQEEVYSFVRPNIEKVTNGINSTVIAFGQSGSGKTYTMLGKLKDQKQYGVIPRAAKQIFATLMERRQKVGDCTEDNIRTGDNIRVDGKKKVKEFSYLVKCSYMQIYNDKVYDLLCDRKRSKHLGIREREDVQGKVKAMVVGLSAVVVHSMEEVLTLLRRGECNRAIRDTELNAESSRSHAILQMLVECNLKSGEETMTTYGKMNLVDLAGSEKWNVDIKMEDAQQFELRNINQSLSALGNCISALSQPGRTHIPYRDSVLTRLLQDSLGGNTSTIILTTISTTKAACEETLRTLKFADRAKSVMQRVETNQLINGNAELATAKNQIKVLHKRLQEYQSTMRHKGDVHTNDDTIAVEKFQMDILAKQQQIELLAVENKDFQQVIHSKAERIQQLELMVAKFKNLVDNENTSSAKITSDVLEAAPTTYTEIPKITTERRPSIKLQMEEHELMFPKSSEMNALPIQLPSIKKDAINSLREIFGEHDSGDLPSESKFVYSQEKHAPKTNHKALDTARMPRINTIFAANSAVEISVAPSTSGRIEPLNTDNSNSSIKHRSSIQKEVATIKYIPDQLSGTSNSSSQRTVSHRSIGHMSSDKQVPNANNQDSDVKPSKLEDLNLQCTRHQLFSCVLCPQSDPTSKYVNFSSSHQYSEKRTQLATDRCIPHSLTNCILCSNCQNNSVPARPFIKYDIQAPDLPNSASEGPIPCLKHDLIRCSLCRDFTSSLPNASPLLKQSSRAATKLPSVLLAKPKVATKNNNSSEKIRSVQKAKRRMDKLEFRYASQRKSKQ